MSPIFISFCILLLVLQGLAIIPWLWAVDIRSRKVLMDPKTWTIGLLVCAVGGAGLALYLESSNTPDFLGGCGRLYLFLLTLQLAADAIVLLFFLMLTFWPKGGAVAQAAFREGLRQPMFWVLAGFAAFLMLISPFLPYFTFGEDLKMVKNLCFEFTMLSALLFGMVSAAISVHEEIEGRTAITVMSKPISRRQFFLGKFTGILMSSLAMTVLIGLLLVWIILFKDWYDQASQPDPNARTPDPAWVVQMVSHLQQGTPLTGLIRGLGLWTDEVNQALPGLILGFCQVMVLVALATALATRLPMVVNLTFCLAVYFLGNLAPIMAAATRLQYPLLSFVSQVFVTVMPGLDLFDVSSNVTRDVPLPVWDYYLYTFNVLLYALTYSAAALIFGLILFEDRDLA